MLGQPPAECPPGTRSATPAECSGGPDQTPSRVPPGACSASSVWLVSGPCQPLAPPSHEAPSWEWAAGIISVSPLSSVAGAAAFPALGPCLARRTDAVCPGHSDLAEPPAGVSVLDVLFLSSPSLLSGRKRASEVLSLNHFSLFLIYLFLIGG